MTLLTRRSLLRAAAFSPLLIRPAHARRVGGSSTVAPVCTPITADTGITGPGCYQLTGNVTGDFAVPPVGTAYNNVTVLGNGHTISGQLTVGRGLIDFAGGVGFDSSGIVVQDLVVGSSGTPTGNVRLNGNNAQALTPLAVHVSNITLYSLITNPVQIAGSNVLFTNSTLITSATLPTSGTDDPIVIWNTNFGTWSYFVTIDNVSCGQNFDVGIEGLGTWHNVTISNCVSTQGVNGGFGAWYGPGGSSYTFTQTGCRYFGNTLSANSSSGGWFFADGSGGIAKQTSDAGANGYAPWSSGGNLWGVAAGGAPNIYV